MFVCDINVYIFLTDRKSLKTTCVTFPSLSIKPFKYLFTIFKAAYILYVYIGLSRNIVLDGVESEGVKTGWDVLSFLYIVHHIAVIRKLYFF